MFFADLALKQDDFGSILPEYSAVVFDEAHEMEDVASDYFGRQISNYRFEELARDADQTMRLLQLGSPALLRRTQRIRERSRAFFDSFPARDGRFPFSRSEREAFLEQHREAYDALATVAEGAGNRICGADAKSPRNLRASRGAASSCARNWRSCSNRTSGISSIGTSGGTKACFWRPRRST